MSDEILRFIFDATDVRGEWVQLERSYRDALATHHYAPGVRLLLGEFLAAASLLSATLKVDGTVTLQARSQGEIPLIMAEASAGGGLRGIVHGAERALSGEFAALLGSGQLFITIEPTAGPRYQGCVSLEGDNLAACLEHYFRQSEQLPTRLWLAADSQRAAGLFLQQLPARAEPEPDVDHWQHLVALAATVTSAELVELDGEKLLYRLFHQEPLRLLRRDPLQFRCSCSRQRTSAMLISLGRAELEQILLERGSIDVTCEFCNQRYSFGGADVAALFDATAQPHH
jgi:molecular chaperone Hsp33